MIHVHKHPICEYDEDRNAIIRAADFLEKCLPEKCVITFFKKELEQFVQEHNLPTIGYLHSEVLDIPIYKYKIDDVQLCITMPFCTAPGAAGTIEEKLDGYLAKVGVAPGACTFAFLDNDSCQFTVKGRTINGTYTLNKEDKTVLFNFYGRLSMTAHVSYDLTNVNLVFDADKLLALIKKVTIIS